MPKKILHASSADLRENTIPSRTDRDGTNYPIGALVFTASTGELAHWKVHLNDYTSGELTFKIYWYALTGTSGTIDFRRVFAAVTPEVDTQDVETDGVSAVTGILDTHLGTTAKRLHVHSFFIGAGTDGFAADDMVIIGIGPTSGSGTLTGDFVVPFCVLSYA